MEDTPLLFRRIRERYAAKLAVGLLSIIGVTVAFGLVTQMQIQEVVIASGAAAAFLPKPVHYVAYLVILHILLRVLPRQASLNASTPGDIHEAPEPDRGTMGYLPAGLAARPVRPGLLLVETEAMVVTYLDLLAKVGFVVIAVNGRDALQTQKQVESVSAVAD